MIQICEEVVRNGINRGGNRGYNTTEERIADVKALEERGFDYFTTYKDTKAHIALMYGKSLEAVAEELKRLPERTTEQDKELLLTLQAILAKQ